MTDYIYNYEGEEINISEMPQGCVISDKNGWRGHQVITLSSIRDAQALITSLEKMVMIYCQNDMIKNIDGKVHIVKRSTATEIREALNISDDDIKEAIDALDE